MQGRKGGVLQVCYRLRRGEQASQPVHSVYPDLYTDYLQSAWNKQESRRAYGTAVGGVVIHRRAIVSNLDRS